MGKVKRLELWWQLYVHVTSGSGLRKFQADGFFFDRVYNYVAATRLYFESLHLTQSQFSSPFTCLPRCYHDPPWDPYEQLLFMICWTVTRKQVLTKKPRLLYTFYSIEYTDFNKCSIVWTCLMFSETIVYFLIPHMSLFIKNNLHRSVEMKEPTHVDYKKNLPSTHPAYIWRTLASSTGWIKKSVWRQQAVEGTLKWRETKQNFSRTTWREATTWKTSSRWEDNIEISRKGVVEWINLACERDQRGGAGITQSV